MGSDWPGGRRSVLRQRAGNSRSFFSFFFFFSAPPTTLHLTPKRTHFTLVLLHSFLGVPFMTVRLQVHSPFSFSTFSSWTFPSLRLSFLSLSLSLPSLSLFLSLLCSTICGACRMTINLFFLEGHNHVSSFHVGFSLISVACCEERSKINWFKQKCSELSGIDAI